MYCSCLIWQISTSLQLWAININGISRGQVVYYIVWQVTAFVVIMELYLCDMCDIMWHTFLIVFIVTIVMYMCEIMWDIFNFSCCVCCDHRGVFVWHVWQKNSVCCKGHICVHTCGKKNLSVTINVTQIWNKFMSQLITVRHWIKYLTFWAVISHTYVTHISHQKWWYFNIA